MKINFWFSVGVFETVPFILLVSYRFSGVTAEDLESATITLRDVQAVLLSMFSAESILIGHSLESDLLALKVGSFSRLENMQTRFILGMSFLHLQFIK